MFDSLTKNKMLRKERMGGFDIFFSVLSTDVSCLFFNGKHSGAVDSTTASQHKVFGFKPFSPLKPFCMESVCSPYAAWVFSRCSGFLPRPMQIRSICYSNLPVGVHVCANGCLSFV